MTIDEFLEKLKAKFVFSDVVMTGPQVSRYALFADYYDLLGKLYSAAAAIFHYREKQVAGFLLADKERDSLDSALKFLAEYGYEE